MKKWIALILWVILILMVISCAAKDRMPTGVCIAAACDYELTVVNQGKDTKIVGSTGKNAGKKGVDMSRKVKVGIGHEVSN